MDTTFLIRPRAFLSACALAATVAASPGFAQSAAPDLAPATVRSLQHALMQGGYAVRSADGVWGAETVAALREFQRVRGLPVTGRPDARTMAALGVAAEGAPAARAAAAPVRALGPGDLDRDTVRTIQKALSDRGLQVGSVDGEWGELTRTAIANLQRQRGLPASGEPDAHTLAALGLLPGSQRPLPRANGLPPGPSALDPAAIRLIQGALRERGQDVGVDGQWGGRTETALRAFQQSRGIEPRGEPDIHTLVALGLLPGGARTAANR
ncbi:MAG TPA: peptidoglycan-binding domain-containing protein [Burkholderiaceae bacterium]|nr:peptidoglycan-binding domain-containing protein [Burkholderiaceae bacterium]